MARAHTRSNPGRWPQSLGFPLTVSLIAVVSLAVPVPLYFRPETRFLTIHNTAWITWTFFTMAMPVAIAFMILMTNERHMSLRHSLSETQRIFTSSWWTGEPDAAAGRDYWRRGYNSDDGPEPRMHAPPRGARGCLQASFASCGSAWRCRWA